MPLFLSAGGAERFGVMSFTRGVALAKVAPAHKLRPTPTTRAALGIYIPFWGIFTKVLLTLPKTLRQR